MAGFQDVLAKEQRFGILRQAIATGAATAFRAAGTTDDHWADFAAKTEAFKTLWYFTEETEAEPDTRVKTLNYASATGTMKDINRSYRETVSVMPTIPFRGYADIRSVALHFYAALQSITEGESSPFTKTGSPVNDRTLDFQNNEGYLHTVVMENYTNGSSVGDGRLLKNALLSNFRFELSNLAEDEARWGVMSGTWVGIQMLTDQYFTGTWGDLTKPAKIFGYNTEELTNDWILNLVLDDTYSAHCWHRFAIEINNNPISRCRTTGGKINNWQLASPTVTIEIDIPMTTNNYKIFDEFKQGTLASFDFYNETPVVTAGGMKFTNQNCEVTAQPGGYDGEYNVWKLVLNCLADTSGRFGKIAEGYKLVTVADGLDHDL